MRERLTKSRKRLIWILAPLALVTALFVPLPFPESAKDRELAAPHALDSLTGDRRVLTSQGVMRLYDAGFVHRGKRRYFDNRCELSETVFLQRGFRKVPLGQRLDVDRGDVYVSFSDVDIEGEPCDEMQFSYVYGSVGA